MKRWVCTICGYVHEGDEPPDICPVCGAGKEAFVLQAVSAAAKPKRWKCTVCDYIYEGETPPEICPVCGVGADKFVLIGAEQGPGRLSETTVKEADEVSARAALERMSYGLYVVSSRDGEKLNAQCANTVFQLTSKPPVIAVCLNKQNLTHEYVMNSGKIGISVLKQDDLVSVRNFGYSSGRQRDKLAGTDYILGRNGCPILKECAAYIEAEVTSTKTVDVGTHTLFVAAVTGGSPVSNEETLTYAWYRSHKS